MTRSHNKAPLVRCIAVLLSALTIIPAAWANATGFEGEVYATSEYGTTYRLYATFDDPGDQLVAVFGTVGVEGSFPLTISATEPIFQSTNSVNWGEDVVPMLFALIPGYEFDSWLTIGASTSDDVGGATGAGMLAYLTEFNLGNGFTIDDVVGASWYIIPGECPEAYAGDDLRVLVAQITTDGDIDVTMNFQWNDSADNTAQTTGQNFDSSVALVPGCTDAYACNYDDTATEDDNSCTYADSGYDCDGNCLSDADGDLICDADEVAGCQDDTACNYDASATDAGACDYADSGYDCDGNCLNDADGDGICDEDEVAGCQDDTACNYDVSATDSDGTCTFPAVDEDCDGNCTADADGDGVCDGAEIEGCMSTSADNYDSSATDADDSCTWADGLFTGMSYEVYAVGAIEQTVTYRVYANFTSDDVEMTAVYGTDLDYWSISSTAPFYQNELGSLLAPDIQPAFFAVDPLIEYDTWLTMNAAPGEPQEFSVVGLGSFSEDFATNGGDLLVNTVVGASLFYTPGSSTYALPTDGKFLLGQFTTAGVVNLNYNFQYRNTEQETFNTAGVVLQFPMEGFGCTDPTACNYDASATSDNGMCDVPDAGYDCDGNCLADTDGDGVCDANEVAGCLDETALNYNSEATDSDEESCIYGGCMDASACNFDSEAAEDDGSCTYADSDYDCDGNCWDDFDSDGVCDDMEVTGCMSSSATNYDASATDDDGSCTWDGLEFEGMSYDVYAVDAIPGTVTYRVYAEFSTDEAGLTAYFGEDESVWSVSSSTSFYQAEEWGNFAWSSTPFLFSLFPHTEFDSWLTLGVEPGETNEAAATPGDYLTTFEAGGNIYVDDQIGASVYVTPNAPQGVPDAGRVFIAQLTTDGVIDLIYNFQYRNSADASVQVHDVHLSFPLLNEGCMDVLACNYDEAATEDDGTCYYAEDSYDCDGNCLNDADGDAVCDEFEVAGCADATACNFSEEATDDDGTCWFADAGYDCEGVCLTDTDGDGVCDEFEVAGCTNAAADNYNEEATDDDGTCVITGCMDAEAANYNPDATDADDSCLYGGCGDEAACNYESNPDIVDNNACEYPQFGQDCDGNCIEDYDGDAVCEGFEVAGCASESASNYDPAATDDDGSCVWDGIFEGLSYEIMSEDGAGDGQVTYRIYANFSTTDIFVTAAYGDDVDPWNLSTTASFYHHELGVDYGGNMNPGFFSIYPELEWDSWLTIGSGPGDYNALSQQGMFNFLPQWNAGDDLTIDTEEGASIFLTPGSPVQGNPDENGQVLLAQVTSDGVVWAQFNLTYSHTDGESTMSDLELTMPTQISGCMEEGACNYDATANFNDGSCWYAGEGYDCDGVCLVDTDEDGVCDMFEIAGCMDAEADNYNEAATDEDGGCIYYGCMDAEADNYDEGANEDDGTCIYYGCMDVDAANYDEGANEDDGTCIYPGCTDAEADNYDAGANEDDGSCLYYGCTDAEAANYDEGANFNDGTCIYPGCTDAEAANYDEGANENDGSCIYPGCTDADADNYDAGANEDDGSCLYYGCTDAEAANYDEGANFNDDTCIYPGCTDAEAANYDEGANENDGSCIYPGCTDADADNYDAGANEDDGSCLYYGCTDAEAANYDEGANFNDGTCIYPGCTDAEAANYDEGANENDGSCIYPGCMDPEAVNYDEQANEEDGSCDYYGCTDETADNYDAGATLDDGSCVVAGCQYLDANNYNPAATYDDGSCAFPVLGCMDPEATNFDPDAEADSGCCQYGGCTSIMADNYDATASSDDGSCVFSGCTDEAAANYLAYANNDDGSCLIVGCMDPEGLNFDSEATYPGGCDYPDACPGDLNEDSVVDVQDLLDFFQLYGTTCD